VVARGQFREGPFLFPICTNTAYGPTLLPTVQGYLAHQKPQPPLDFHRALGIVLMCGPKGACFFMSEETLWGLWIIHTWVIQEISLKCGVWMAGGGAW
jgi:hypothetical protein